jgi:hypothetical protein
MMKKRFQTKFVLLVSGNRRTETFFTCRECRGFVEIKQLLPHQDNPIRVLYMEEPNGITIPEKIPNTKQPTSKETVFHITPAACHDSHTILSPKPQRIIPPGTLLALMSNYIK